MSGYVLLFVGCLECGQPTDVEGVFATYEDGLAAFTKLAADSGNPVADTVAFDEIAMMDGVGTAVELAGTGGSYWYPVQLHRVG